jgi:hypothetical protein
MTENVIKHERLLSEHFRENPLWTGLTDAMDAVINPNVQNPAESLAKLRWPDTEPYYAFLNARMLGFKIPSLSFTDMEYSHLMRNLGRYRLTCGSSNSFIRFLAYIKRVEFIYVDLWANSLDMPIYDLQQNHGKVLWEGGDWFPTSYYDIVYSLSDFPTVDEEQFRIFITQLAPIHLVLRQIIGIQASTAEIYFTAIPLDRQRTTVVSRPL